MKKLIPFLFTGVCLLAASITTSHAQLVFRAGTTTTGAPGSSARLVLKKAGNRTIFNFTIPQGPVGASPFTLVGSDAIYTAGNVGIGTAAPVATLDVNGSIALQGAIKVPGAGIGTGKSVFVHKATVANVVFSTTNIDNPFCNNDPNAILIVTQNWNPGNIGGTYNDHVIGVFYNGTKWSIFNEGGATMPVGAAFNVLVVKP